MARRVRELVVALAVSLVVASSAACADDEQRVPSELMDGSPARGVPVELEGIDGAVVRTSVRVTAANDLEAGSAGAACVRERAGGRAVAGPVVERVGVSSESVTLTLGSGRSLLACDNARGPREEDARWCGGAFALLVGGRLRDARLDVLCSTGDDEPLAFVWIEPHDETRYVAVEHPGFTEVYQTAADLPVRVASTREVDLERSTAELAISEHDAAGGLVRRYDLRAAVAG